MSDASAEILPEIDSPENHRCRLAYEEDFLAMVIFSPLYLCVFFRAPVVAHAIPPMRRDDKSPSLFTVILGSSSDAAIYFS